MPDFLPSRRTPSLPAAPLEVQARPAYAPDTADSDAIDFQEVLAVLRRRSLLILLVSTTVTAAAAFVVWRTPAVYRAHAVVRLKDTRGQITAGIEGTAASQVMGRTADPVLSQMQVLRSRAVAGTVVDRLGLRLRVVSGPLRRSALQASEVKATEDVDTIRLELGRDGFRVTDRAGTSAGRYGQLTAAAGMALVVPAGLGEGTAELAVVPREQAIDALLRVLRATVRENTDVVDVDFASSDPRMAQAITNAFVQVFQEANAEAARQDSHRRRVFVEEQLRQTDSLLAVYQQGLSGFRSREQLYSSKDKYAVEQQNLMNLQVRREELAAQLRVYQQLVSKLDVRNGRVSSDDGLRALVAAPDIATNPVIAQLYSQLVNLESARDSLVGGRWGSSRNNPDVLRLDTLISTTRGRILGAVQSYVTSLEARVSALDELQTRDQAVLSALPGSEAEETKYVQQVEITRNMADQLRAEYQKARIAEAVEVGQIQIVDLAGVPTDPIGMGRTPKLILALLFGLMLGGGAGFVIEHLNTSIRRKEDVEQVLNIPGLALIPRIAPDQVKRRWMPQLRNGNGSSRRQPVELVSVSDSRSSGAEAYRKLRTNLIFSQAIQSLRRVLVTSSDAGEGKTTTVTNLAATFAQQGMRVLIVDGDLRRPRMHHALNLKREPGLAQVLLGESELATAIQPSSVPGLFVLTAGATPPNAAELLASDRVRVLLDEVCTQFDFVLIDSPPVNAAADALVLSTLVDGVIVVIRAGQTDKSTAQHALEQLEHVGAKVIGAVLNDPDAEVPKYDRYYAHHYYQYEYYGDRD